MSDTPIPSFSGEVQLASWTESHTGGCKATFWFQSSEDLEPFKAMTARKGSMAGQRLMAVFVEIGDDERPVEQPKPKVGALCLLAVQWCKEPKFWEFLNQANATVSADVVSSENEAANLICFLCCDIGSRKELDTNAEAGAIFDRAFRKPYMAYLKEIA